MNPGKWLADVGEAIRELIIAIVDFIIKVWK